MATIFKYEAPDFGERRRIELPVRATFLSCGAQGQQPVMWFSVNEHAPREWRTFEAYPTGTRTAPEHGYLGTYQIAAIGRFLVGHLYEVTQ